MGTSFFGVKLPWPLVIITAFAFILYYPALKSGFTNWDDQVYVTESQLIQDFSPTGINKMVKTPVAANYHPLTVLSLALNYKISGFDPFSYHLFNVLLHILNSLLVFYFIYIITGQKTEIAFITGFLFAVHPMHVESVAWVAARKDVLYSFFFLSALITYCYFYQRKKTMWLIVTAFLFILSLASKPAAVVLPLILIILDYYLGRKLDKKAILEKIPFLMLSLITGLITLSAQGEAGALGDNPVFTFMQKILFASHSLLSYLFKSIIPAGLSAFHPYPFLKGLPVSYYIAPVLVLAIAGCIFYFFRKNKMIVFGSLFFFINIVIVLQLLSFGNAVMAERYTYLPYIGLFFIIGSGFSYVIRNKNKQISKWKNACIALVFIFSATMCSGSYKRIPAWKNSETLWTGVVQEYPLQSTGWYNLGHYLSEQKQYERSIPAFSKAIEIRTNYYEAHYNRGQAYRLTGKDKEAVSDYTIAMAIKPGEINTYRSRATSYFTLQEYQKGLMDFERAVELAPADYNCWFGRGNAHFYLKEFDKALQDYKKTLELSPNYAEAYYNMAITYGNLGDKKKSLENLLKSEQLGKPRDQKMMDWLTK